MDICINTRTPKNPRITCSMDIRTDMDMIPISYLSNRTDTDITLSASIDIHLHPYIKMFNFHHLIIHTKVVIEHS